MYAHRSISLFLCSLYTGFIKRIHVLALVVSVKRPLICICLCTFPEPCKIYYNYVLSCSHTFVSSNYSVSCIFKQQKKINELCALYFSPFTSYQNQFYDSFIYKEPTVIPLLFYIWSENDVCQSFFSIFFCRLFLVMMMGEPCSSALTLPPNLVPSF